ncbi:sugar transferase [Croceimicrobium sp.]|uniref:sugar transferase n=1 Tax=Croceimicrobium sp. TaxID=2828340 RepID=UPI003BAC63B9
MKYQFWDSIAAILSYTTLFVFRKLVVEAEKFGLSHLEFTQSYYIGLLMIPIFWLTVYHITDFYRDIYRRSRLKDLFYTFNTSLLGSIFIFFALILDDSVASYTDYYRGFLVYFSSHFFFTALFRTLLTTRTAYRIRSGNIAFNSIMIGSNEKAAELYAKLESESNRKTGHNFVGFVSVDNNIRFLLEKNLEHLGNHKALPGIIREKEIEEVIIAIESSEHHKMEEVLNLLEEKPVKIKMIPDTYDIISGKVRMESMRSIPLVEINHQLMPVWQMVLKRIFDVVSSALVLILLSPLYLTVMLITKISDKGPVFFKQKRVGFQGKEFYMYKFRSMVVDAEENGPQLSSENDERITPWGKIMRKYRLDELPQFYNVLTGDMSIVGPRPERKYYMELISQYAPHYRYLQKVRPGITSWGMVKFGYASNVDEMVERLKYDVIYIENMSLLNDIKILIYTVIIVLQGRGK